MSVQLDEASEAEYLLGKDQDDDNEWASVTMFARRRLLRKPKAKLDQTPQQAIDEFWTKFTTKAPGKGLWSRVVSRAVSSGPRSNSIPVREAEG
ncbi:hypothetical protein NUW58_g7917 [Xylaria curta]|uniref:Uncharacterized protein n=1 Tax=Xylaria curta TaxID=42375 RepID=A0ACC1NFC7_9PEZI|nr:hypothetical protein NUW58_g7917 [Xylaria curta]